MEALMLARKTRKALPLSQILLISMGILVVYLVVSFARQVGVSHQRREELRQLEGMVGAALEERAQLEEQLVHTGTEQAVRQWALANGMTKPDEVLVVMPPSDPVPAVEEVSEEPATARSPREAWWDFFFGTR
jgi:hypothetical protein